MVRVTQGPVTPGRSVSNPDSLTDLNRLLARLQQSILQADAERERRLRTSEYERNKVRINLEYARTLLTKLEQDALNVKVHTRRVEVQADLNRRREIFDQLAERLRELEEVSINSDDESEDGEDLLSDVVAIATPSQSSDDRTDRGRGGEYGDEEEDDISGNWDYGDGEGDEGPGEGEGEESTILPRTGETPQTTPLTQSDPEPRTSATGTTTSQTLRPRGAPTTTTTATPTTNDKAETTALRSQLFGDRPTPTPNTTAAAPTATTEAIMDHHRQEQDKLTASMVSMAQALKESSQRFSSALREDQDVLAAANHGLDRNERGLDGVAGRMGSLRRLTEGEGWWGRMLLYAWIAGLAVCAVLLVFVGPKLRF